MLTKRLTGLTLTVLLMGATAAARAQAPPDPNEVAQRCINRMRHIAQNCGRAMNAVANHAADRINELQANGQDEAAQRVARRAIMRITQMGDACLREIHRTATECVRLLRRLGASQELIDSVRQAAGRAAHHVRGARRHAVGVVLRALHD